MSGGHFDYIQHRIRDVACELRTLVEGSRLFDDDSYPGEVIDKLAECACITELAALYIHRVDWLLSGDDSEETFIKRTDSDLREFVTKRATNRDKTLPYCDTLRRF